MKIPKPTPSYHECISKMYQTSQRQIDPLNVIRVPSVTFQVTDACNLNCSYCYQINKSKHKMPFSIAKQFIDLLLENNELTAQYLDTSQCYGIALEFIGGEPFLEVELIDQILEYFQEATIKANHMWARNWKISISSNGTLYFNDNVQNFIKKYFDRLSFNISIDGNKKLHDTCRVFPDGSGSYDLASAAAYDYIYNLHGYMGSKITLSPENIQYTCEAIKDFIDFGYQEIYANCIFEEGWTIDHAIIYYNQLKQLGDFFIDNNLEETIYCSLFRSHSFVPKLLQDDTNWCGGNGKMLAVDYKGDIYPCLRYMESSLGDSVPPIIIGNVKDGFMPTEKEKQCVKCLKQITRLSQSTEECINCPIATGCAWCQAYNYQYYGNFNHRTTFICDMHKASALANAYYWNKCYIKHGDQNRMHLYLPEEEALRFISKQEYEEIKKMELL